MTLNSRNFTKAYASIGVQTRGAERDPYELALMMFEAVLENVNAARGAIAANDITAKIHHLSKAIRILQDGLRTSLDIENGGELAQNLADLYDYCILRLTQANAQNDAEAASEVVNLIKPLAEAWRQMRTTSNLEVSAPVEAVETKSATQDNKPPSQVTRSSNLFSRSMAWVGA